MSVKIIVPTPLRPSLNNQDELTLSQEGTIKELLLGLVDQYPNVGKYLFDDEKELRKFVNFYVNDEDIRDLDSENTQLKSGDTLSIVPSIAGGSL